MKNKKNNKILARVGAIMAAVLLVALCALPAFADVSSYVPSDEEFEVAFEDFIPDYMHEGYRELSAYLSDSFFIQSYFNAMTIYSNDQQLPFVLFSDLNYTYSTKDIDEDYYIYVNYNNIGGSVFYCYFTYSFVTDRGDNSFDLTLTCYSHDDDSTIFEAYYTGTTNSGTAYGDYIDCSISQLTSPLYNNGERLDERYFYIGLVGAQLPYSMAMVTQLLFYINAAIYPTDWYEGGMALAEGSYIKGNTVGREHGYNDGFDEGYDEGYTLGHNVGYNQGLSVSFDEGYDEGYSVGYDDGSQQTSLINVVTAIFRAPMDFIDGVLNFDIFGINMAVAVRVLITMAIIAVVVTVVWKAVK